MVPDISYFIALQPVGNIGHFCQGIPPTSLIVRGVTEATSGLFLDLLVYGLVNSLSRWTHRH